MSSSTSHTGGALIVLEGIDGCGKTTQARLLADHLRASGRSVHLTRQPSDGPIGRHIREMIVARDGALDRRSLALLFAADRIDHVHREVIPCLTQGGTVISDRWYHSSLAYQARFSEELRWVIDINAHVQRPDLTLLLQVSPEVAADRRSARGQARELFDDLEVQRGVAAMYECALDLLRARGERVAVLDGSLGVDELHALILSIVAGSIR